MNCTTFADFLILSIILGKQAQGFRAYQKRSRNTRRCFQSGYDRQIMLPRCSGALSSLKYITHRNHFHGSAAAVAPSSYSHQTTEEGKEGVELGQYLYEIYNHDVELRVSKARVNLLLSKWMKELVKIFYGNIVSYDAAMLPGAKQDELQNAVTVRVRSPWVRNIFSDDGTSKLDDATLRAVQACIHLCFCHCVCHPCWMQVNHQLTHRAVVSFRTKQHTLSIIVAMTRYVRREVSCLSLTGKEAIMFSGNFMFTPLETTASGPLRK
ncbi:hypothetical protein Patl1_20741 [Pistacia atlantica]|uniref:Uncharacterized protein n=1 Tax=Pistacia atlantica TaxID=434234 RepID=A0ACC1BKM4_9ROSI|nr:hypothetical protein Patl1_20741 [Pistacia atlantica]